MKEIVPYLMPFVGGVLGWLGKEPILNLFGVGKRKVSLELQKSETDIVKALTEMSASLTGALKTAKLDLVEALDKLDEIEAENRRIGRENHQLKEDNEQLVQMVANLRKTVERLQEDVNQIEAKLKQAINERSH